MWIIGAVHHTLIIENNFCVNLSIIKVYGKAFTYFKVGKELIIGFVKDLSHDNKGFFEIKLISNYMHPL